MRMKIRQLGLALAACVLLVAGTLTQAKAVPIAAGSEINITGVDVASITSTEVTFTATKASVSGETGSFTSFGDCVACATLTTPLIYSPFTAGLVYTATNGAEVTSFTITSQISAPVFTSVLGVNTVTIVDAGTASLTGFDTTAGEWVFTGNTLNGLTGSFSATTAAVAEPAAMLVLLVAFVGLFLVRRGRRDMDGMGMGAVA